MSLQGSLRQLGLADVLQTALAGREGNLILRRGATRAVLHVATDQLHLVEPDPIDTEVLLEGFVHRGLLPAPTLEAERARQTDALGVLDALMEQNVLPWSEVDAVLRGTSEDAILDLLTWQDGEFRFEEGERPPDHAGLVSRVGVDIGGMLLRAAQRLDEHNVIAEELGLEALLFIPMNAPPPVDYEGDPTPTVHTLLDGHRVIDEVAMLCGLTRFAVLRSVFACVRAGAARTPTVEELEEEASRRIEADQLKVARGLLLQWASLAPNDEAPLLRLADLAKRRQSPEEHADALQALGHLMLRQDRCAEAQDIFKQLLQLRPGDESALQSLCEAAEAAGDTDALERSTLELARTALEADEAEKAAALLETIVRDPNAPLQARVLRARALIRLKDRDQLIAEAEAAAQVLGHKARRRDQKDAARFFRDAIATLAPERSDLLRRFRSLTEGNRHRNRQAALVVAFLAVLGAVGYYFRPESASSLAARIDAAWSAGDAATAQQLTMLLAEKHPDAPETEAAFRKQAQHTVALRQDPRAALPAESRKALDEAVRRLKETLVQFPAGGSADAAAGLYDVLRRPEYERVKQKTLKNLGKSIVHSLKATSGEMRHRADQLARATSLAHSDGDIDDLREFIARADDYLGDDFGSLVQEGLQALSKLLALYSEGDVQSELANTRAVAKRFREARSQNVSDIEACKRLLVLREIEATHDVCLRQATHDITMGRLDKAEARYRTLQALLDRVRNEEVYRPLAEEVRRRRIPDFLEEKLGVIADIRRGLASAKAAREAGDLERAVRAYTDLAEKFWLVRLESVIDMPIEIVTVPAGAHIRVNGHDRGRTPLVLDYPWDQQHTITLERDGFESETRLLGTRKVEPVPRLEVRMMPKRRWTTDIDSGVLRPPVEVDGDLVLCERGGRIVRYDGLDGHAHWARHVRTLEGTKARPVQVGSDIALVFLDGTLVLFDAKSGEPIAEKSLGRPVGDPVYLDDTLLVATLDGRIQGLRGDRKTVEVRVGNRPTCGLVLAHGRAWLGLSNGHLLRIDRLGAFDRIELPGRSSDVVGIAPHAEGVLVSKGDGMLLALDIDGRVLWSQKELGDLVGTPARAGSVAAVVDTRGRVLLFSMRSGEPKGQIVLGSPSRGGLLASGDDQLIALRTDGVLWMHDPVSGEQTVNADFHGRASFPPLLLDGHVLALSADGDRLALIEVPKRAVTEE